MEENQIDEAVKALDDCGVTAYATPGQAWAIYAWGTPEPLLERSVIEAAQAQRVQQSLGRRFTD